MGVHLSAYKSSVASTSLTSLQAVTDIYPQDGTAYLLKSNRVALAAMAGGGIIDHARINQPSLNMVSYPSIEPVNVSATGVSNCPIVSFPNGGLPLKGNEDLKIEAANSSSTSTATYGTIWHCDSIQPVPQGPVYKVRGTATTTLVAYTWTQLSSVTYDTTLTQGTYSLVGITGISAGAIAVRANLLGQFDRPGFPALTAEGGILPDFFRDMNLGQLGTFPSYSLPNVEFFSSSADTSETIYIHVIKIG